MAKVAIVEDELTIAQMYRFKFEAEGYEVQHAENGKLGLQMVEQFRPDVLLLDLMMPEMNGEDMLEAMRQTDWGKDIKVVILTNRGDQEIPDKVKTLNVSSIILIADMTPRQVAEVVKNLLTTA
jgi:DNA-binding response OmpR family regulator